MSQSPTKRRKRVHQQPTKALNQSEAATSSPSPFKLIQTTTSLPDIPPSNTDTLIVLVHATNAFGTWGAGFAKALQRRYPSAELVYKAWCDEKRATPSEWPSRELVGLCQVVPPQDGDQKGSQDGKDGESGNENGDGDGDGVAIACLFTSYGYGGRAVRSGKGGGHAAKDGVGKVIESTRTALVELREWIGKVERGTDDEDGEQDHNSQDEEKRRKRKIIVYSPKFNSGNFGVDWEVTADMIREAFKDWEGEWRILTSQ